jgi:prophage regulatory protein
MSNQERAQTMRLLRKLKVKEKTGLAYSTMYELISVGKFPRPVRLTDRCSAWVEHEVDEWCNQRVAERDHA